jgi:DNA ligase (NAD+)
VLNDVRWQVGRRAAHARSGKLEPVFISGVTGFERHAAQHRPDPAARPAPGDTIVVERSGEVIPYVVEVQKEKRPEGAKKVERRRSARMRDGAGARGAAGGARGLSVRNTECDAFFERKKVKRDKLPPACPEVQASRLNCFDAGIDIICPK